MAASQRFFIWHYFGRTQGSANKNNIYYLKLWWKLTKITRKISSSKKYKLKNWKNLRLDYCPKKQCRLTYVHHRGNAEHFLSQKINFEIFRFLNLERFQKLFKIEVKIWKFLTIFFNNVANFCEFLLQPNNCNSFEPQLAFTEPRSCF